MSSTTRKLGRISVDLDKLHLPGPGAGAGWVRSPPNLPSNDLQQAIQVLGELGLTDAQIQALQSAMAIEYSARTAGRDLPTAGDDRKVIEAAASLAEGLAYVLRNASPNASAQIATALYAGLGVGTDSRDLDRILSKLAQQFRVRVDRMPSQTRARPRTGVISELCRIAGSSLPAPTKWPASPFYRAAQAAFALAGMPGSSPDRAIDDFLNQQDAAGR